MKNVLQKIVSKYHHLAAHIQNKGLGNFISAKIYDNTIKLRLYLAGVNFSKTAAQQQQATATSLNNDAHENQPSSFYDLKKGFSVLPLSKNEIELLDIGCGSGRVMNYCMLQRMKKVIGIDLDEEAISFASNNCTILKQKGSTTNFSIEKADATAFSIPHEINTVYMFNPFGGQTMQAVAANIISHAQKNNKAVYLIYCMPSFKDVFEANASCRKIYEEFNKNKTHAELAVYAINA